ISSRIASILRLEAAHPAPVDPVFPAPRPVAFGAPGAAAGDGIAAAAADEIKRFFLRHIRARLLAQHRALEIVAEYRTLLHRVDARLGQRARRERRGVAGREYIRVRHSAQTF